MSQFDNKVLVDLSEDKYEAYLTVVDDTNIHLTTTYLQSVLKQSGIINGIDHKVLSTIVQIYQKENKLPQKVKIANGIKPFAGQKPEVDLKFEFSSKPKENGAGKTDYREISNIISVQKDQLLAIKRKIKQAVNGITVTGNKTIFPRVDDLTIIAGKNVIKDEQENIIFFRAKTNGTLQYDNDTLSVYPTLEINEDVDFNVGNIHFKGDVIVHRDILPDFVLESGGNVSIWGSVIAATVKAKGDVDIRFGVVGKNKGEVQSLGSIKATFIENARLIASSDIIIKNGIIGSYVKTDGFLSIEARRSRIVGCYISAGKGISCFNVGSRYSTNTELITGINSEKEQEYKNTKELYNQRIVEIKKIENKYGNSVLKDHEIPRALSENARNEIKNYHLLKQKIQDLHQTLKDLESEVYDYNATIRIKENLYPRVTLKIGKFQIISSKEHYNVTIRYSEEEGRMVIL